MRSIPRQLKKVIELYLVITLPFLMTIGSARLVMTEWFLLWDYQRDGFPIDAYGFTTDHRLEYGVYGIHYIVEEKPISYLGDLRLSGELCYPPSNQDCPMFNDRELSHMVDVQLVASWIFRVGLGLGILAGLGILFLWKNDSLEQLRLSLFQGSCLTIGLIIAIILLAISAWDIFFSGFHALFFEDGTWEFFYSDTLIRLYPEQFWFDASVTIGMIVTGLSLLIIAITWRRWSVQK